MGLVVGGFVACQIQIVQVEKEALRAGRGVGSLDSGGSAFAGGGSWSGLTELYRDLSPVGESGDGDGHNWGLCGE